MALNFFTNQGENTLYKKPIAVSELMILEVKPTDLIKDKK